MRILGIDPGTVRTGLALLENNYLTWATVVTPKGADVKERLRELGLLLPRAMRERGGYDRLVIEWQAIRPGDPRPNDILHLATVLGIVLAHVPAEVEVLMPLPVEWRGSVPKDVLHKRILAHVPGTGPAVLHLPATKQLDAIDAAGLAAWGVAQKRPWN